MALQDLLFKKVLNLFFEVFPSFFHVSVVVDITYTKIQSQLWLYNNYYYYNYHYFFTYISILSLISNYLLIIMEWSLLFLPAHRLKYILQAPPDIVIGVSHVQQLYFSRCLFTWYLRSFVSAVFYFKLAVIFNNLINYAFEHI